MPKRSYDADSDGEPEYTKKSKSKAGSINRAAKSSKESSALGQGKDAEGNPYFEVRHIYPITTPPEQSLTFSKYQISNLRRVGLQPFNGKMLINIREYYNAADGELKPGKKVRQHS